MKEPKPKNPGATLAPDKVKLNRIQAQRLSSLTNISVKEIEGRDLAELSESFKWRIDPDYFLFRRDCGQVVRWVPGTGQYQPVPFATVHVMDTDCDFLAISPTLRSGHGCIRFFAVRRRSPKLSPTRAASSASGFPGLILNG